MKRVLTILAVAAAFAVSAAPASAMGKYISLDGQHQGITNVYEGFSGEQGLKSRINNPFTLDRTVFYNGHAGLQSADHQI